jgi:hypothetical protein
MSDLMVNLAGQAEVTFLELLGGSRERNQDEEFLLAEWGRWQRSQLRVTYKRIDVEIEARRFWEEAGCPEGRDVEFWTKAEQDVQRRAMAAAGISGACSKDSQEAKSIALTQFCRRRCYSYLVTDPIDRETQPSNTAFMFFCQYCGVHIETLPSDYMFEPRKTCSQCKGLLYCKWLKEAVAIAEGAGYVLKQPRNYHEIGNQSGKASGGSASGHIDGNAR